MIINQKVNEMQTVDEKINKLLKEVETRKAEIKSLENPRYRTNLTLTMEPFSTAINLNVLDIRGLLNIKAYLAGLNEQYNKLDISSLGNVYKEFKYSSFSYTDWEHDIDLKIGKILILEKKRYLSTLEDRLNKIMSPELKAKLELEEIEKALQQ
jgi:hypothetical protein